MSSPQDLLPRPKFRQQQSHEGLDEILSPPKRNSPTTRSLDGGNAEESENIQNDGDDDFARPLLLRNDQSSRHGILSSSSDADTWNGEEKKRDDEMYDTQRPSCQLPIQRLQPSSRLEQLKEEKRKLEAAMSLDGPDLIKSPSLN